MFFILLYLWEHLFYYKSQENKIKNILSDTPLYINVNYKTQLKDHKVRFQITSNEEEPISWWNNNKKELIDRWADGYIESSTSISGIEQVIIKFAFGARKWWVAVRISAGRGRVPRRYKPSSPPPPLLSFTRVATQRLPNFSARTRSSLFRLICRGPRVREYLLNRLVSSYEQIWGH